MVQEHRLGRNVDSQVPAVADTFEVPLEFLMTPDNHQRKTRDWKGIPREYYAIPFGDRYIWGITAGILRNLYDRIYGA